MMNTGEAAETRNAIAVVGMGIVTPGANTPAEFWTLLNGHDNVFTTPDRFDMEAFHHSDPTAVDSSYAARSGFIKAFGPHTALLEEIEDNTVPNPEPSVRWLRHTVHSALDGVRVAPGDRWFAAVGYTPDGSWELERSMVLAGFSERLARHTGQPRAEWESRLAALYPDTGTAPYHFLPHSAGKAAIEGLLPDRTELVMVDTACSSGLYTIDLAVKALREGSCEVALCGGAFALVPRVHVLFAKIHGLSPSSNVRAFDRGADGVLFSDGAGAVVLKTLGRAISDGDRVLGVIEGVGLSCDGKGKAIYAPNADGQMRALHRACADANVDPSDIGWVIAHGTGTPVGDRVEVKALTAALGSGSPVLLSANKSIVGHTGWSAGLISLIHGILGFQHGKVPSQGFYDRPIEDLACSRLRVPTTITPLSGPQPLRALISAFGFGGTNAHLIMRHPEESPGRHGTVKATSTMSAIKGGNAPAMERDDEMVLVGWGAELPGRPSTQEIQGWLDGTSSPPATSYGSDYPLPSFREVPLPPPTLRSTDRAQLMLLAAAAHLPKSVHVACERMRDTTGVVVGHMGPTRNSVNYALRCHLKNLRRLVQANTDTGTEWIDSAGLERVEELVRSEVPAGDDAMLPGIMPNIIASRVAALRDLRGLNMVIDSGPDSSLDALRTAERYLRHGSLEVVLVAAVSGNSTPELSAIIEQTGGPEVAEGAFVLAVTRASTAKREGMTVLASLRTATGPSEPAHLPTNCRPLRDGRRTYLAADPMVAILAGVVGNAAVRQLSHTSPWGSQLSFHTVKRTAPATVGDRKNA
ncbi:3-oxoacyl-(acyl-carrier-protein) synthase [Streptomyces sp. V4I23]|uniref:beta-ketoacyl synthase N-terminal-like domain-containing protein n=1 Tax=Streptomyces sp. V4I23 TaxID=3042282 RepID=UPI002783BBD6|nr:beta-ketoacyl synthase N-terminal-like domain-containing protein [Streptomyces sp. V4I23]MDQ1005673.1 3-oxoacyl-(acyl-carrier-protein) synthase [Streptomyces sp. V4I23]